jgi:hypothetical protein
MLTYALRACLYVLWLRQIDLCYILYTVCATVLVGVLPLRHLCIDWHLPVCGGMKQTILILYYSLFTYALHMPSLLCGCWASALTVCFICGSMAFYIFSGVSSFSLQDFRKPFLNLNFLKMHWMKLADGSSAKCCLAKAILLNNCDINYFV